MKLDNAIEKRRSVRKFTNKKVKFGHVLEAIDAALKAPFAGNMNSMRFVIVSEQESINKLAEYAQQTWMNDASFIVIVCANPKNLEKVYQDRGKIYLKQQVGAAIQNFLLKITDMKLASCWIGAFLENYIKEDFKIPEGYEVEALLPVGYPSKQLREKRTRKEPLEKMIYWEKWGTRKKPTRARDATTYYDRGHDL